MITLKSSSQKVIEKDQQSSSQTTEEEDSEGGTRTLNDFPRIKRVSMNKIPTAPSLLM